MYSEGCHPQMIGMRSVNANKMSKWEKKVQEGVTVRSRSWIAWNHAVGGVSRVVTGIWLNRRPAFSTADLLTRHVVSAHGRGGVRTQCL